jgi:hypothetical protein
LTVPDFAKTVYFKHLKFDGEDLEARIIYEPVTLVITPHVEQPQFRDTTPKLQNVIAAAKKYLIDAESRKMEELLTEYGDTFAMESDDYGRTDTVDHSIDTWEV